MNPDQAKNVGHYHQAGSILHVFSTLLVSLIDIFLKKSEEDTKPYTLKDFKNAKIEIHKINNFLINQFY